MKNILETEEYVSVSPYEKDTYEYRITYAMKESIRTHKWIEGEKGRNLTWEEACNEWRRLYEKSFRILFARRPQNTVEGFQRFPLVAQTYGAFTRLEYTLFGLIAISYMLILIIAN